MKRYLALLLACTMLLAVLAACGGSDDTSAPAAPSGSGDSAAPADSGSSGDDAAPAGSGSSGGVPDDPGGHYTINFMLNYDWATGYMSWGEDMITQHWNDMFDVTVIMEKPDMPGDEPMTLRIAADDLPDAIWMERGDMAQRMARMGLFVPINDMKAKAGNDWYDGYVGAGTQKFYEIDGVNYYIPNWARMGTIGVRGECTGGNSGWMYTTNVYNAVGSPEVKTYDDLYNYAVAVRDANLTNTGGAPIIPLLFHGGDTNGGLDFIRQAIYPTFGGHSGGDWFYTPDENGNYVFALEVPLWREAILEANHWYREGLFPATNLTNTRDEFLANLNNGRGGLIWWDQSDEDNSRFRSILRETDPGNSIEMFVAEDPDGHKGVYLPAFGMETKDIYHHVYGTLGWNAVIITTKAENPVRIFNLFTWPLTMQGSVEMMYGPPGPMYDEVDANGFPILHTTTNDLTAEEQEAIGTWKWNLVGASNFVDAAKFAADSALPPDQQDWVITNQRLYFTPNMILSDEFENMNMTIDPTTDLGIQRKAIQDNFEEVIRSWIMADSREACILLMDEFEAFANANNVQEIVRIYNENYQANKAAQGGWGVTVKTPAGFTPRG